ncbi:MAG: pyruvate kinase [Deltaproteobacteria bacterium]|nr:pyruvate kinase [Deltaproteobacteria bacterium]
MGDTRHARRLTRIVATIGPASDSAERIDAFLAAGMDVARLNCAHATPEYLRRITATLRERAASRSRPLAILADLAGPKLRIGTFSAGPVELHEGDAFTLTTEPVVGDAHQVSVSHSDLPDEVQPGSPIYLNDGLVRLEVVAVEPPRVRTRVLVGGPIDDRKGLAAPTAGVRVPSLTEKDRRDLEVVVRIEVDYVGLSFVRSARDVRELREAIAALRGAAGIVAKIEKAQAVEGIDDVVDASDAIMVARGDLGVELPIEDVPILQKRILAACRRKGKPAITATQMLESMVHAPMPTRAEVTDVANAVLDGTDAVMLSGETAIGAHPVASVRMMDRVIRSAEAYERPGVAPDVISRNLSIADAVSRSACAAAESAGAAAIVALTATGSTARSLARWRPRQPIVGVTADVRAWRALSLVWGVDPILVDDLGDDFEAACERAAKRARARLGLAPDACIVVTAGLPFSRDARTNTLRVLC